MDPDDYEMQLKIKKKYINTMNYDDYPARVTGRDRELIVFLRDLADSIEEKNVVPSQLEKVGEFFMSYQFRNQLASVSDAQSGEFSKEDLLKFLSLGWYVYQILLKDQAVPHDDLD